MKITRLVFILVLLASVILVPNKTVSAADVGTIDIAVGTPTMSDGQLNYLFTVTYGVTPTTTSPVDARVVVMFQHPDLIDSIVVTNNGGQVVNVTPTGVEIPQVTLAVGSTAVTLAFNVTFVPLPGTIVGTLPLTTSATATIYDNSIVGSLPVSDTVTLTLGASGVTVSLVGSPSLVKVGQIITFTVTLNTTSTTVLPVNVRAVVSFAHPDRIVRIKTMDTGLVIDNTAKTVTWEGPLVPAGTGPVTFTFMAAIGSLPAGSLSEGVFTTFPTSAMVNVVDVNVPGSLPAVSDSESFTIEAAKMYSGGMIFINKP